LLGFTLIGTHIAPLAFSERVKARGGGLEMIELFIKRADYRSKNRGAAA
jgi:hypothetical protein